MFILRKIKHPFITRFYELITEHDGGSEGESTYLLIFDYYSGGNLREFLESKRGNFTHKNRLKIAYQIAVGMRYLHEIPLASVIHLDLNTKNILVIFHFYL